MPLWKNENNKTSAPKFVTDSTNGDTGIGEYGEEIIYNDGKMGIPASAGWVRKTIGTGGRAGRVAYETITALRTISRLPEWVPVDGSGNPAELVLDINGNRGWYDGGAYPTESEVLDLVGGEVSGFTRKFGDYVSENSPELLNNGDFSDGIGDWVPVNGPTSAVVDGHLEMSGAGLTNPTIRSGAIATQQGKTYRLTGTYWKGTGSSPLVVTSRSTSLSPVSNGLPSTSSTTPQTASRTFGGEGSAHYVGLRTVGGPNGTVYGDNFSVKEAAIFEGFSGPSFSTIINFKTPAVLPASSKVLFSFDDDGTRNRYRAAINPTGTITVVLDSNGATRQTITIPADIVTLNEEHKIHVSSDGYTRLMVCFNDTYLYGQQGGFIPAGFCWTRIGASTVAGEEWTGEILKVAIFNREVVHEKFIWAVGDSYVAGTGGASLEQGIEASNPSRLVIATGVGGSSIPTQLTKMKENPGLYKCVLVHWDGDANSANLSSDQSVFEEIAGLNSRHIFVGSGIRMNHTQDEVDKTIARNAWLSSRFGSRYVDPMPTLIGLSTGSAEDLAAVAAGKIPPSCLQVDGTHLTPTAMQAVGSIIVQKITDLGW